MNPVPPAVPPVAARKKRRTGFLAMALALVAGGTFWQGGFTWQGWLLRMGDAGQVARGWWNEARQGVGGALQNPGAELERLRAELSRLEERHRQQLETLSRETEKRLAELTERHRVEIERLVRERDDLKLRYEKEKSALLDLYSK